MGILRNEYNQSLFVVHFVRAKLTCIVSRQTICNWCTLCLLFCWENGALLVFKSSYFLLKKTNAFHHSSNKEFAPFNVCTFGTFFVISKHKNELCAVCSQVNLYKITYFSVSHMIPSTEKHSFIEFGFW